MEEVLNDQLVIPERIKNMSKEERAAEIKRLEQKVAEEKRRIIQNKRNDQI